MCPKFGKNKLGQTFLSVSSYHPDTGKQDDPYCHIAEGHCDLDSLVKGTECTITIE